MSQPSVLIVDGANVVGSRPDGWWRDRPGAARRLTGLLVTALAQHPQTLADALGTADLRVHLVLEGAARAAEDLPTHPHLVVHRAEADGDGAIVALAGELADTATAVLVATADRELRARVRAAGASVISPSTLLRACPSGRSSN